MSGILVNIRSLAVAMLLMVTPDVACGTDDPCGNIPSEETWRFVMVVDGSGSMSMNGLWDPMRQAIRDQVSTLPDDAELQIIVFNGRPTSRSTRAEMQSRRYRLDDSNRSEALRWVDRLDCGGPTPLYYTLEKILREQEAWLREQPATRFARLFIYTDGEDTGFDRDGNQRQGNGIVTKADVDAVLERIQQMEIQLGVRFEGREIAIGGHRGSRFKGIELLRGVGQKIPIPVSVSLELTSPELPPVRGGETQAMLEVTVQCPELVGGAEVRLSATSDAGFPLEVEPSTFPLVDGVARVVIRPQGNGERLEDGFRGTLRVAYPTIDPLRPLAGPSSIQFKVAAEEKIELDAVAVMVRPQVVLRGRPVSPRYLRPLAGVTPEWSRGDGAGVTDASDWSASTVFEEEGDATIRLQARRGDLVSETIVVTVPVRDVALTVSRVGDSALLTGDAATFQVDVVGIEPIAYQWRVDGRPIGDVEVARVEAALEQPGKVRVEVRGRLDLGDGNQPLTDWIGVDVDVAPRPEIYLRAPLSASWGRPLRLQVLVDGDIERVRVSLVDASTGETVGDSVTSVVRTKTLAGGKGVDRVADVELPLPERAGEFVVKAESIGGPRAFDESRVEIETPVLSVTLDDPPPVSSIRVGESRRFELSLGDDAAEVIKQADWMVTTEDGERLPIAGFDEPAAIDSRGIRAVGFDLRLPDDGSIAEGEVLLVSAMFTTANGVQIMPEGGTPRWRLAAEYSKLDRRIVGSDGGISEAVWGDTVVFSIEPPERIASVAWRMTRPDGSVLQVSTGAQFEVGLDQGPGEYRVTAIVQPDVPNAEPVQVEAMRTVTVEPVKAKIEFPAGREARGERLFTAVVTTDGSVKSAELVFTQVADEDAESTRIPVDLKAGSGSQSVETSSGIYGPKAAGEIEVMLAVELPDGSKRVFSGGTLNHRGPPSLASFAAAVFVAAFSLWLLGRFCLGNGKKNVKLLRAILDDPDPYERSFSLPKGSWSWWQKRHLFMLRDVPYAEEGEDEIAWLEDEDCQGEIKLIPSQKMRKGRTFAPIWDGNPDTIDETRADDGIELSPRLVQGATIRLRFRLDSGFGAKIFPGVLAPIWWLLLLGAVWLLFRLAELWIL